MKNRSAFPVIPIIGSGNIPMETVESTEYVLLHNGCQLHYWMAGPSEAPLVVLTHSEGTDHHSFDAQLHTLASFYRVLTWDIRGHGLSVSQQPFSLDRAVDDLQTILTHEGYTQAIFVGISVGGTITQLFAHCFPDAMQGMALLSCTPIDAVDSTANRIFGRLTARLLHTLPYWFIRAQMPAYFSIRPDVQEYIAEAMKESGQENFLAAWQAYEEGIPIEKGLGPATQPVLVALGAYDRPGWTARAATLWRQANPDIRPVIVPGAGHALHQDNPAFSTKMLDDFLHQCVRQKRFVHAAE